MPGPSTAMYRLGDRTGRTPPISELEIWRAAARLREQFPETPWLEAARRADCAFAAGRMFNFRLWGRVTHALRRRHLNGLAAA
jgi:hypothetical protein